MIVLKCRRSNQKSVVASASIKSLRLKSVVATDNIKSLHLKSVVACASIKSLRLKSVVSSVSIKCLKSVVSIKYQVSKECCIKPSYISSV